MMAATGQKCGPGRPEAHGITPLKRTVYRLVARLVDRMASAVTVWPLRPVLTALLPILDVTARGLNEPTAPARIRGPGKSGPFHVARSHEARKKRLRTRTQSDFPRLESTIGGGLGCKSG
jgi:hypothetical protein